MAMADPAQQYEAFSGAKFTMDEIDIQVSKMAAKLQWLLLDQFSVSKIDIAVVAKKGFTSESMWRHMGENRAEFLESAKAIMGLGQFAWHVGPGAFARAFSVLHFWDVYDVWGLEVNPVSFLSAVTQVFKENTIARRLCKPVLVRNRANLLGLQSCKL